MIDVPIPETSPELRSYISYSYAGEFWVDATRAFIDAVGPEKTLTKLCAEMRNSGHRTGMSIGSKLGAVFNDPCDLIYSLKISQQMKGNCSHNEHCREGEITECPFSSAPVEICQQYESFYNGLLEVVFPNHEFVYDRMMSKGDKTCHWTIKKKNLDPKKDVSRGSDEEEMLKKLKWRLTNGEITLEEYRHLKEAIMDK